MSEKQSKYGELIKRAREENQKTKKPKDQKTSKPEEMVNLCAKVPKSHRQHWAAEAKRKGVTMTDVMIKALEAEFGLPQ